MASTSIGIADAVEQLRIELSDASRRGQDQSLRFIVEAVELELAVEVVREAGPAGKVSFKILGSGVEVEGMGRLSRSSLNRVAIKLVPDDERGGYRISRGGGKDG